MLYTPHAVMMLLILCHNIHAMYESRASTQDMEDITHKLECALLFFGIGRKFGTVAFPSIKENILDVNPTCDVLVHTYNVSHAQGRVAGEDGSGLLNASELILLSPRRNILFETEEEFQLQRNISYYRSFFPKPSTWDYPASMDNMIRQWHSIEQVWTLMETFEAQKNQRYDMVALLRSDVLFTHPIMLNKSLGRATIPQLMYHPNLWGGYNDRMFYGRREFAKPWATQRFSSAELYLQWQKSTQSYQRKTGLHSEDFLRWLFVFHCPMTLKIEPICFMRIRSSGAVRRDDCKLLR